MDWQRYNELKTLDDTGNTEAALPGFENLLAAVEIPDERAVVLLALVGCFRNVGRRGEARDTLSKIYALVNQKGETLASALFIDACLDMDDGNWKRALTKLDSLITGFAAILGLPENQGLVEDIQRKRGIALYNLRRPEDAYLLLEKAVTHRAERAAVLYYLGRCYYELGNLEKSENVLSEALSLDLEPVYRPSAHYVLGLAYHWQGQEARALGEFKWCLENDEKGLVPKWKTLTAAINALKALGLEQEAKRYSEMLRKAPRSPG